VTTTEKLILMRQVEARNADRIKAYTDATKAA